MLLEDKDVFTDPKTVRVEFDIETRLAISSLGPLLQRLDDSLALSTKNIIESNQKLSASNDRYSKWMKWLTLALVVSAFLQVIVNFLQFNSDRKTSQFQQEQLKMEKN